MTTYTLFGQAGGGTLQDDFSTYTMGLNFSLSQDAALTGIWFYSAPDADALPTACGIFQISGATLIASDTSPSWSGAPGSGWVKCTFGGSVTLTASTPYKTCILKDASEFVYSVTGAYWSSGPGADGLTSGIISAPNDATAGSGQDSFVSSVSVLTFPGQAFNASNYWVDVEVTTGGTSHTATAALTVTPSFTATTPPRFTRTGSLTVAPSFSAPRARGHSRTGSLTVTPSSRVSVTSFILPGVAVPGLAVPGASDPGIPSVPPVPAGPATVFSLGEPYFQWATGTSYLS